jgi:hypothetical protein
MKFIKTLLLGMVIGIAFGMWWGVNIGKGQPFYANPFKTAQDRARDKAHEIIDSTKNIFK